MWVRERESISLTYMLTLTLRCYIFHALVYTLKLLIGVSHTKIPFSIFYMQEKRWHCVWRVSVFKFHEIMMYIWWSKSCSTVKLRPCWKEKWILLELYTMYLGIRLKWVFFSMENAFEFHTNGFYVSLKIFGIHSQFIAQTILGIRCMMEIRSGKPHAFVPFPPKNKFNLENLHKVQFVLKIRLFWWF